MTKKSIITSIKALFIKVFLRPTVDKLALGLYHKPKKHARVTKKKVIKKGVARKVGYTKNKRIS